jgi:pyridoxal phosphate enzyme (YggS family)
LLFLQADKQNMAARIKDNLNFIKESLGKSTKLIAISKTKPVELIRECYDAGQRLFGENKVQEMTEKQPLLPADIEWHLVGHLQTNKVKFIAPFVSLIHSVDSLKLLEEINRQAVKNNRIQDCLLQIYIAREETKFGLSEDETIELLASGAFKDLKNISITGLMGMATNTDDLIQVRFEFRKLKEFRDKLKKDFGNSQHPFKELSMGMSGDYKIAIEEGSTLVRIGSSIFGERS